MMSSLPTVPPSVVALPTGGDNAATPAIPSAAATTPYSASTESDAVVGALLVGKKSYDQMYCFLNMNSYLHYEFIFDEIIFVI